MPQESDSAPNGPAVRGEVLAKYHCLARAQPNETSTDTQQRGLTCTVRPSQQEYLSGVNVKVDSS